MGYDMRYRKADPDEKSAVAAAEALFRAACDEREALPAEEEGVLNFERARASGDFESHEMYDGRSDRWRAAQDKVHAAYEGMYAADKAYFRLNVHGMGWARGLMEQLGMAFEAGEHPPFPDYEDFGTDADHVDALRYPEDCPDVTFTDSETLAAVKYNDAVNAVLEWHGPEIPGIPLHKFGSNDGWVVLPAEAEAAVRIWQQAREEMSEDDARALVGLGGVQRDRALDAADAGGVEAYWGLWLRWIAYLAGAVKRDGFEVH